MKGYHDFEDHEFWYKKGYLIPFRKHAGRIKMALKKMAKKHLKDQTNIDPLYAMALLTLKLGRFQESLNFTYHASSMSSKQPEEMQIKLLYLAALNNKKLKIFRDATLAYSRLTKL